MKMGNENAILPLFLIFIMTSITITRAIVCPENYCSTVTCEPVKKCKVDQVLKNGGFCGCCKQCFTVIGENGKCSSLESIRGIPPPPIECDFGLVCYKGVCRKIDDIVEMVQPA